MPFPGFQAGANASAAVVTRRRQDVGRCASRSPRKDVDDRGVEARAVRDVVRAAALMQSSDQSHEVVTRGRRLDPGGTARARSEAGAGDGRCSVITRRSADELKLKKGDTVSAVIKATEVMIQKD